jgi:DNA-binding response OmpR family regulator
MEESKLEVAALVVEPAAYRATLAGRVLPLSRSHLELLAFILANRDRVVSRDELAAAGGLAHGRSVDVALSALRRELGEGFLRNVRNRGWILEPDAIATV